MTETILKQELILRLANECSWEFRHMKDDEENEIKYQKKLVGRILAGIVSKGYIHKVLDNWDYITDITSSLTSDKFGRMGM